MPGALPDPAPSGLRCGAGSRSAQASGRRLRWRWSLPRPSISRDRESDDPLVAESGALKGSVGLGGGVPAVRAAAWWVPVIGARERPDHSSRLPVSRARTSALARPPFRTGCAPRPGCSQTPIPGAVPDCGEAIASRTEPRLASATATATAAKGDLVCEARMDRLWAGSPVSVGSKAHTMDDPLSCKAPRCLVAWRCLLSKQSSALLRAAAQRQCRSWRRIRNSPRVATAKINVRQGARPRMYAGR